MPFIHATATSTFRGGSGQFISGRITPAVRAGVKAFTELVLEIAQQNAPVGKKDTGQPHLRDTGKVVMEETGKRVIGHVVFTSEHALYIEMGWGSLGASGPFAGPYDYSTDIQGYIGTGFMRSALDTARDAGKELFKSQVAAEFKF